jgi:outer membrane receptor for ferrienterochelin and colicin
MIPAAGPVIKSHKHPKLERLRKASNCYTDLYHNDLVNLSKSFAHIFGIRSSDYRETISKFSPRLYLLVEKSMDRFILEAWSEQYDAIRG